jgi:type IX secretion system PorP/SprF family membrane protein
MNKNFITLLILFLSLTMMGQDIHFTQFTQSPIYLNPANSGAFDGDIRLTGNYKNQWASVPVPYNTTMGSVDFNLAKSSVGLGSLGAGVLFYEDNAGDARLTSRAIYGTLAWNKLVGEKKKSVFSVGINIGYNFKSINLTALRWDEQYNGDFFDPKIPTTELLNRYSMHTGDFGMGIHYLNHYKKNSYWSWGFSMQHINSAGQSFYLQNDKIELQRKPMLYASLQTKMIGKWYLKPDLFYQWQDGKHEFVTNLMAKYYINDKISERIAIMYGVSWRVGDAWSPVFRMEYQQFTLGMSYDINTSNLTAASSYNGGFELSLIYIAKIKKAKYPYNFCPYLWM